MARILNVTHSRQETEAGCLAACAQMALSHLGIERSQSELARLMGTIPNVGTIGRNVLNLQSCAIHVIYAQGTFEQLRVWLAQDVPVIAFVQTSELPYWGGVESRHTVTVVGTDEENVYLLDPAQDSGVIAVSLDDFALAWEEWMDGRFAVITHSGKP